MPTLPDGTQLPYPEEGGGGQEAMLAQLLAGMGGGQQPSPPEEPTGDWLVEAINQVHKGMIEEGDPKQVSLLGAILNQLTTFQANRMTAQPGVAQ